MLVAAAKTPVLRNKNYVVSGAACAGGGGVPGPAPRLEIVTREAGRRVDGADLRSYADIRTAAECAALCHRARGCEAYEHMGAVPSPTRFWRQKCGFFQNRPICPKTSF